MAQETPEVNFRVTLRNSVSPSQVVSFAATPDLNETRNVNYKTIDPIHAPGQILAYGSTSSRNFNLSSVKLISRTPEEAALNLQHLWMLRSWGMPDFGLDQLTEEERENREIIQEWRARGKSEDAVRSKQDRLEQNYGGFGKTNRGAPPAVLLLSAYSRESMRGPTPGGRNSEAGHINRVPVVITNMSVQYPSDQDYIPAAGSNVPMPMILPIDMTLMETHSPREYEKFSLSAFKRGALAGF